MSSAFYGWLNTFLKDRGLQLTKSGFKGGASIGKHVINDTTGFWDNVPYSAGKPPRWLFQIEIADGTASATLPNGLAEIGIGGSNTAQGDKASLAVRILPLLKIDTASFNRLDDFEINGLFVFHGPLSSGSSSDSFSFNPASGTLKRLGKPVEYIYACLLGLRPTTDALTIAGSTQQVTYGEVLTAIRNAISICPKGQALGPIPSFDLANEKEVEQLKADFVAAWNAAGPAPALAAPATKNADESDADEEDADDVDYSHIDIPVNGDLLGIDPAVYRQINALLKSGKQHLMLYGPPGTGKTSLARWIATNLPGGKWTLVTGSSDWSSQDIIGGYQPVGESNVDFVPGILLREFNHPLIIDELNRCDIDKVIGSLFTVLSGQQTTLPYRVDITDKNSLAYTILPMPKAEPAPHEFAPGQGWRLIATINSIDKASLYQMSYALSRRFGWVYVDAPTDLAGFVRVFLARLDPTALPPDASAGCPLSEVWKAINSVRVIGPAPIIDTILAMRAIEPAVAFFGPATAVARSAMLDAVDMVILPMLDGIVHQDAMTIANAAIAAFAFDGGEQDRLRARLEAVAI